ncbi:MAG: hypothetical protein IKO65_01270 [Victivallales bacterium]|nr:hypothetical protein [Victivallales bacterium]
MQLFELKSITRSSNKRPDGSYKVSEQELGVFDSVEKAEAFMKMYIDKVKGYSDWQYSELHCFVIYEKTLNRGLSEKWDSVCEFEGIRSYYPDGTLYCDSPYDDACEKPFRGRPAETIKLKVGDIAWCWWGDGIHPCLVAGLPMTDVHYQQRTEKLGHEMGLDYTDDSYTVYLGGYGHDHPACWLCMPYYGKISKRTLQRLYACKRREEAENEQWRKEQAKLHSEES